MNQLIDLESIRRFRLRSMRNEIDSAKAKLAEAEYNILEKLDLERAKLGEAVAGFAMGERGPLEIDCIQCRLTILNEAIDQCQLGINNLKRRRKAVDEELGAIRKRREKLDPVGEYFERYADMLPALMERQLKQFKRRWEN